MKNNEILINPTDDYVLIIWSIIFIFFGKNDIFYTKQEEMDLASQRANNKVEGGEFSFTLG